MKCVQISFHFLEEGEKLTLKKQIIYIAGGSGEILSAISNVGKIQESKSYWIDIDMTILSTSRDPLKIYSISVPEKIEAQLKTGSLAAIHPTKVVPGFDALICLQKEDGPATLFQQCQYQAILWNLLTTLTDVQQMDNLEETIHYIEQNISENLTVSELAARAGMTSTAFARAFKKKTGLPPKEYVVEKRIKKAKELIIQNKGIAMKDISHQLGIQDEFYFSRMFKRREGVAPSFYVKRAEDRVAVVSQLFLQDHLLSLGVQPVAAPMYPSVYPSSNGVPSYLTAELEGTLLLDAEKPFNPQEILQTNPDHIIKTTLHHGECQTVGWTDRRDVHTIGQQSSWNDYLQEIAGLVGKEKRVASIEKDILDLEQQAKDQLCPITKQGGWAVLWVRSEELRLYGYSRHACLDLLFQTLGFEPHQGVPKTGYKIISLEDLVMINPDKILILWSSRAAVNQLITNPSWKFLNAVQNKDIYIPNSSEWDPWGPLGRKYMIRNMLEYFQHTSKLA